MDKYKTVVQGEASESEEEEDEEHHDPTQSVVVEGEASESDEEEIDTSLNKHNDIPPIKLSQSPHSSLDSVDKENGSLSSASPKHMQRPKYDSILNKKLWESNLSLCNNLNGLVSQTYLSAAKEISNYCQQLSKSHTAIQDVSHSMRLMTNDLLNLDDRIDIITTCKLLPDIKLPSREEASSPQPVQLNT